MDFIKYLVNFAVFALLTGSVAAARPFNQQSGSECNLHGHRMYVPDGLAKASEPGSDIHWSRAAVGRGPMLQGRAVVSRAVCGQRQPPHLQQATKSAPAASAESAQGILR